MKITFLGTGAADWNFDEHGSMPEYRRNSSALIDGILLIDPGPDVLNALETFSIDKNKIKYIINTHSHSDHYCKDTVDALSNAEFFTMRDGEEKEIGSYTISAYKANHSTCDDAVHFIIENNGKKLFYGLDGAWLMYDEIQAIKSKKPDYAVLDATIGNVPGDYRIFEHNNLNMVLEMRLSLMDYVKKFCISHMARTLHGTQKELETDMAPFNIDVAYDGFITEI